jgi:hypothetical protein
MCTWPSYIVINKKLSIPVTNEISVNDNSNKLYWYIDPYYCDVFGWDCCKQFRDKQSIEKYLKTELFKLFKLGVS